MPAATGSEEAQPPPRRNGRHPAGNPRFLSPPEPSGDGRGQTALLGALGALLVASTVALGYFLPLSAGRMARSSAGLLTELPHWAFLAAHRSAAFDDPAFVAALVIAASVAAFGACVAATWLTWRRGTPRRDRIIVISAGVLAALLNVGALPNENSNIWNYILRGRVAAVHGENPYVVAAREFPDDPITPYAAARNTRYPGGKYPGWMIWNVAMARIAGDDPVTNLLAYRVMLLLFSAMNVWLVAGLARRLIPQRALAGIALWAWNPIVIMNGQAKTDTVMVFYLLLGMTLLVRGRKTAAGAPLALSVLVKLLTAPLLAVAAIAEARAGRWRDLAFSAAAATGAALIVGLPFLIGVMEKFLGEVVWATESTSNLVTGPDWLGVSLRVGFAALVVGIGLTRDGSSPHLFRGWAIVQLYFSLFFAKFGSADYHMTLFAIVAVTMGPRILIPSLALGFGSFLFDEWYRLDAGTFHMPDLFPFDSHAVLLIPLAAVAVGYVLMRRAGWLSASRRPAPPQ
jgi:Glycosyltransferase family 87